MRSLSIVTGPAEEPITGTEAVAHLRVDHENDDTLIGLQIKAARELLEAWKGQAFVTQTLDLWLDRWPRVGYLTVPRPPLQSVTSITYYDSTDQSATMSASDYHVDTNSFPGRIILGYGKSWPSGTLRPGHAIRVRYVAGYGAASAVPESIKAPLKLLLAHLYEQREPVVTGTIATEIPMSLRALLGERYVDTLVEC